MVANSNKHTPNDGTCQVIHITTNNREIPARLLTLSQFQGWAKPPYSIILACRQCSRSTIVHAVLSRYLLMITSCYHRHRSWLIPAVPSLPYPKVKGRDSWYQSTPMSVLVTDCIVGTLVRDVEVQLTDLMSFCNKYIGINIFVQFHFWRI